MGIRKRFVPRVLSCSLVLLLPVSALYAAETTQKTAVSSAAPLVFEAENPLATEAYLFTQAELHFRVRNTGKNPVRILSVRPRKGGGVGSAEPEVLESGATGRITLRRQVTELGAKEYGFRVRTDDKKYQDYPLKAYIFGQSAYTPDMPGINFQIVRKGHSSPQKITITSYETEKLDLRTIVSSPPWLKVRALPRESDVSTQELVLEATLSEDVPMGLNRGTVHLYTSVTNQPDLVLPVQAQVFDTVSVAPLPATFRPMHVGESRETVIEYQSLDGMPLELAEITESTGALKLAPQSCGPRCLRVTATFKGTNAGEMGGVLRARFKNHRDVIESGWDALVVGPNVKLHDLGVIGDESVEEKGKE
jgi:hypothetical protein